VSQSDLHPPDDLLALHATGDPLPEAMARHVNGCPRCLNELTRWQELVTTGHATSRQDTPQPPPAHVWEGISSELGLTTDSAPSTQAEPAVVVPIARARRWSTSFLVAASVAGLLVGGAAALGADTLLMDNGDPAPVAAPTAVAQTQLVALPDHRGQGQAEIVETAAGTELIVDVSGLSGGDSGDGFFEVWLIDPDTLQMVGLGALTSDSGRFLVPDGLDLSQYRLVDVSLEPFDGDPVHSQDSVVRGELAT
jgi:hypothetical protein